MRDEKTILVVDDEESVRSLLGDLLVGRGYRVLLAADGQKALELAREHVPDLVLVDLLLPGEHGVEVIRNIKDNLFIPVIAMSGIYKRQEVAQQLDDFYLDGFFCKPLNTEELLARVRAVLHE